MPAGTVYTHYPCLDVTVTGIPQGCSERTGGVPPAYRAVPSVGVLLRCSRGPASGPSAPLFYVVAWRAWAWGLGLAERGHSPASALPPGCVRGAHLGAGPCSCCSCGSCGAHLRSGLMGVSPGRCPVAELAPRGSPTGGRPLRSLLGPGSPRASVSVSRGTNSKQQGFGC